MIDTISSTELLSRYGDMKFNHARTIQQAWDKLNSTPYDVSKAVHYSTLRQLMLREYENGGYSSVYND